MSIKKNHYYDTNVIKSYNAVYNFIVGGRGIGKTYGFKYGAIKDYFKHGREFIVLRRYSTELGTRHSFFDDVHTRFPKYDFRVLGMYGQIAHISTREDRKREWTTICYFVALSVAQQKKGTAYPNVHTIIFDEFIIEKGNLVYLKDEFTAFNNFYSTVDRYNDRVRAYFLANSVSIMNPYFDSLEIRPEEGREFITKSDGFAVAHFPDNSEFSAAVYETRFGKFIKNTEYAEYAVENKFDDNHDMLLAIKDTRAQYMFTLETRTATFSVWHSIRANRYFVQRRRPQNEIVYTLDATNMSEEKTLLMRSDTISSMLRTGFRQGRVLFDTQTTRNAFIEVFRR